MSDATIHRIDSGYLVTSERALTEARETAIRAAIAQIIAGAQIVVLPPRVQYSDERTQA